MKLRVVDFLLLVVIYSMTSAIEARVNTVVERNREGRATGEYRFRVIASPAESDFARRAKISIVSGERDRNSGALETLTDGQGATGQDRPRENFFFRDGTEGGRLLVDLGEPIAIEQVGTFSWHPGSRAAQVYRLYGARDKEEGSLDLPSKDDDLEDSSWRLIAMVDTRGDERSDQGGQFGVSIFASEGPLGVYRYLLFDIAPADDSTRFGNTFYSEIDVVGSPPDEAPAGITLVEADGGKYRVTIDTTGSPDLSEWAEKELAPVVAAWYPKIVALLPSEGFQAPRKFTITISDDIGGVAAAGGTSVRCNGNWFRRNLEGEAKGAVVHEMVHIVQQYGRARGPNRRPGWLVEGIADYIRWFLYEPQSRGAEITERSIARARYDASYRISANFLDWVERRHGPEIPMKLNSALRAGTYSDDLWQELTGQSVEQLGAEWRISLERQLAMGSDDDDARREDEGDTG